MTRLSGVDSPLTQRTGMESPISGDLMGLAGLEVIWRRLFGRASFGLATTVL